jgi:hypothetical protein
VNDPISPPPKKEDIVKGLSGIGGALATGATMSKLLPGVSSDWAKAHPSLRGALYAAGLSTGGLLTRLGVDAVRDLKNKKPQPLMVSEAERASRVKVAAAIVTNQPLPAPKPTNLAQDFVAGMDPFGTFTGGYGQRNQQAGISENQHRLKSGVSTAGGLLGGAVIIPGAIGGIIEGARGVVTAKGGVGARLSAGIRGAATGATEPFSALRDAVVARKGLRKIREGAEATPAQLAALRETMGNVRLKSVEDASKDSTLTDKLRSHISSGRSPGELISPDKLRMTPEVAARLEPQVGSAIRTGVSQLALGAGFGGLGAAIPYNMGRKSEVDFQKRLQAASSPPQEKVAKRDLPDFTRQDRPKKVKEIYRALKRDHPNMPAEMKARIAARQGKPGKQHQGPPYKGPIKQADLGQEKVAATRQVKEIKKKLAAGDIEGAQRMAKILLDGGYLKVSELGTQLKQLGVGREGVAFLVIGAKDAPASAAVRKMYDPDAMVYNPAAPDLKVQLGEQLGDNPGFAQMYTKGKARLAGHIPYHVGEYVPGQDLDRRFLNSPQSRAAIDSAKKSLNAANAKLNVGLADVVATDFMGQDIVNPGNIRITPEGKAKIIDYLPHDKDGRPIRGHYPNQLKALPHFFEHDALSRQLQFEWRPDVRRTIQEKIDRIDKEHLAAKPAAVFKGMQDAAKAQAKPLNGFMGKIQDYLPSTKKMLLGTAALGALGITGVAAAKARSRKSATDTE